MNRNPEEHESEPGSRFHAVQPHRDLESNWAVDLAKNLEDYLLKICSGEIPPSCDHDVPQFSINFAEAALLLQGSVQVYSRKVEYLYSLVLHALEFISQKSSQKQATSSTVQPEESASWAPHDEENDTYWGLDNVQAEAKNLLDSANGKDQQAYYLVRPPASLVLLEGDCLDATGEAGEIESYLLATNDVFRDFILLDSCDTIAVIDFLNTQNKSGKLHTEVCKGSSLNSKRRNSFVSPSRRSGGTGHKLSAEKNQDYNTNQSPLVNHGVESNDFVAEPSPPAYDFSEEDNGFFNQQNGFSDDSDSDDPWKPLNPHEPGKLKVKPYKNGKINRRLAANSRKHNPLEFPIARVDSLISAELNEMWEVKCPSLQRQDEPHSPPLYDKLRESLLQGGGQGSNDNSNPIKNNTATGYDSEDPEIEPADFGMPENTYTYEDVPPQNEHDSNIHLNPNEGFEDANVNVSLEDLCRSHLDSLLDSLAETEKQTELAARVSAWKQRIEQNLEEQDSRPPFDIHEYGERVLDKLSTEGDVSRSMSFADAVQGQAKHDVVRTFSALLQLVNNGDVELARSGSGGGSEPICYTAENPFHVQLLRYKKKQNDELNPHLRKKRAKSPKGETKKPGKENRTVANVSTSIPTSTCRFSVKLGKPSVTRCTPEGKKRRKSRFVLQDEAV